MTPDQLLTPEAVRAQARAMLGLARQGALRHWALHEDRLAQVADLVAATTRAAYPDLKVPFHARWRHFSAAGRDRWAALRRHPLPEGDGRRTRARAAFDVAIVSVLLDAGAGADWRYVEPDGSTLARSEGLAVASLAMLAAGVFADDRRSLRADAERLAALTAALLADGFQASAQNRLVGLEGRAALLRRLGAVVAASPEIFARTDRPRPGGLFDWLADHASGGTLPAREILVALLRHLGPIWPGREMLDGVQLGDCWAHPELGLVPLHKLSQWLAYSLVEPLQDAGIQVTDLDALTGLAEYRNGGLFVDMGVLQLRDADATAALHAVGDPLVVEWRALTVALLDELAPQVRARLGVAAEDFPLACVLEGGTWRAGREIARVRRADGGPPLGISSDGTVF